MASLFEELLAPQSAKIDSLSSEVETISHDAPYRDITLSWQLWVETYVLFCLIICPIYSPSFFDGPSTLAGPFHVKDDRTPFIEWSIAMCIDAATRRIFFEVPNPSCCPSLAPTAQRGIHGRRASVRPIPHLLGVLERSGFHEESGSDIGGDSAKRSSIFTVLPSIELPTYSPRFLGKTIMQLESVANEEDDRDDQLGSFCLTQMGEVFGWIGTPSMSILHFQ